VTTPEERTRTVLQTKDFLVELIRPEQTPGIPDAVRREAHRLLRHYPGLSELALAHRALPMFFGDVPHCEPSNPPEP
jgi:hypothetical protein